jgi:hypothetical protein
MGFLSRLKKKANKVGNKMDKYQEAITFAEAGEQEHAGGLFHDEVVEEIRGRLLVVGREATFSREVVDYALEMAQRLSYEILALSTAALSGDAFRLFSSSHHKKLSQDFQALSEENARRFQAEAERLGIPFDHVVRFGERDKALEEISKEFSNIEFVVSDAEEERPADRATEGERARHAIYVYSMTT